MKSISMRKLMAISEVKGKALFSKNFIIMPIFSIGFAFVMKLVYGSMAGDEAGNLSGYVLSIGVVMNICMSGIYCVAASLAEEKEKNTLRTLMTSSVNGLEFFLGSLIPVIGMMIVVNVILVFVTQMSLTAMQWFIYLLISTLASITGGIVGMIFGIFAKNQVSASTMTTPALLVLMMIPMFSGFNEVVEKISQCLFTGIVMDVIGDFTGGIASIDIVSLMILIVEIIASILIFLYLYKKNGFEA
ncbi:ABC transporter permease [Longibaculum muris]|uniref:ABC transporter permease n=1 Tax=Longibaculum muris TaxID=1796628 RepID=UPI003AB14284